VSGEPQRRLGVGNTPTPAEQTAFQRSLSSADGGGGSRNQRRKSLAYNAVKPLEDESFDFFATPRVPTPSPPTTPVPELPPTAELIAAATRALETLEPDSQPAPLHKSAKQRPITSFLKPRKPLIEPSQCSDAEDISASSADGHLGAEDVPSFPSSPSTPSQS
jgi:hypothetical protein